MNRVWTGLLVLMQAGSCAGAPTGPSADRVANGTWGGQHIGLIVSDAGAQVDFDCAYGQIDQPLTLDATGRLSVDGVFVQERGGPVRVGEEPERKPARYSGTVDGTTLTLDVTITATSESIGTFTLTLGAPPGVRKCR